MKVECDEQLRVCVRYCRMWVTCIDRAAGSETHFTDRALGTVQWDRRTLQSIINYKTNYHNWGLAEYNCLFRFYCSLSLSVALVTVTAVRSALSVDVAERKVTVRSALRGFLSVFYLTFSVRVCTRVPTNKFLDCQLICSIALQNGHFDGILMPVAPAVCKLTLCSFDVKRH